jgi:hypothetical protein
MRVYLLENILQGGEIKTYEASPLTGHPDWVQVNGIRGSTRIKRKGQWFGEYKEAQTAAIQHIKVCQCGIQTLEDKIARLEKFINDPVATQDNREELSTDRPSSESIQTL